MCSTIYMYSTIYIYIYIHARTHARTHTHAHTHAKKSKHGQYDCEQQDHERPRPAQHDSQRAQARVTRTPEARAPASMGSASTVIKYVKKKKLNKKHKKQTNSKQEKQTNNMQTTNMTSKQSALHRESTPEYS